MFEWSDCFETRSHKKASSNFDEASISIMQILVLSGFTIGGCILNEIS